MPSSAQSSQLDRILPVAGSSGASLRRADEDICPYVVRGTLCGRAAAAELGAQARQLLAVFGLLGEEFDSIQVNAAIADFAADPDRLIGMGRPEFDLDLASHRQVGGGKKTNSTFAETHTTAINHCSFS